MTNKVMPYALEAEMTLLGNIIIFDEAMREAIEGGIVSDDFYLDKHRKIFSIMYTMYERGEQIDNVSLAQRLKDFDYYDRAGGMDYLLNLTNLVVSENNTKDYVRIIKNKSYARQIINVANTIMEESYDGSYDVGELLDRAENKILDITRSRSSNDFKKSAQVFDETLAKLQKIYTQKDEITGVKSLYNDLDRMTTGFQKGDLVILAARPSVGKTAFALNLAINAATYASGGVAVFSLEMPAEQLATRMLGARSHVSLQKLRTGKLSEDDWSKVSEAINELRRQSYYIDDTPGIKISDMFAKCRSLKNEVGLSLVIVDYIQLIQSNTRAESRQQEVSEISRRLKALARELEVPVIALSQLSRGVEQRQDKKPMLSDLRESGAIEQDADLVMFLYREDYYEKKELDEQDNTVEVELILAKHRNGPTGTVKLIFEKDINAFYSAVSA